MKRMVKNLMELCMAITVPNYFVSRIGRARLDRVIRWILPLVTDGGDLGPSPYYGSKTRLMWGFSGGFAGGLRWLLAVVCAGDRL